MRILLSVLFLSIVSIGIAQNTIYSYAIANWKNGPIVHMTPVIETTEAFTTAQLLEGFKGSYPEFREAEDVDVLRFATIEEAELDRETLRRKYSMRKLEVVLLDPK